MKSALIATNESAMALLPAKESEISILVAESGQGCRERQCPAVLAYNRFDVTVGPWTGIWRREYKPERVLDRSRRNSAD